MAQLPQVEATVTPAPKDTIQTLLKSPMPLLLQALATALVMGLVYLLTLQVPELTQFRSELFALVMSIVGIVFLKDTVENVVAGWLTYKRQADSATWEGATIGYSLIDAVHAVLGDLLYTEHAATPGEVTERLKRSGMDVEIVQPLPADGTLPPIPMNAQSATAPQRTRPVHVKSENVPPGYTPPR